MLEGLTLRDAVYIIATIVVTAVYVERRLGQVAKAMSDLKLEVSNDMRAFPTKKEMQDGFEAVEKSVAKDIRIGMAEIKAMLAKALPRTRDDE